MKQYNNDRVLKAIHQAERFCGSPEELLIAGMNIIMSAFDLEEQSGEGIPTGEGVTSRESLEELKSTIYDYLTSAEWK